MSLDPTLRKDSITSHWTQNVDLQEHPVGVVLGDRVHMAHPFVMGNVATNVTGVGRRGGCAGCCGMG